MNPSMKNRLPFLILVLFCSIHLPAQSWRLDRARLCFDRPENNGRMNIVESWVRIADYQVSLIGGQTACIYVYAGSEELVVTSNYPYAPEPNKDEACKSKTMKLELSANENRMFTIWPTSKGSSYTCGWRIVPSLAPSKPPHEKLQR
jgi:hypothetical protein